MKIADLVKQLSAALNLENSAVIKIAEFEKELRKYDLYLHDMEAGIILFHIISKLISDQREITIDFSGISIVPMDIINECIMRLVYENGKMFEKYVTMINLTKSDKRLISSYIKYGMFTRFNIMYDDSKIKEEIREANAA